jgi:hypothetical protein
MLMRGIRRWHAELVTGGGLGLFGASEALPSWLNWAIPVPLKHRSARLIYGIRGFRRCRFCCRMKRECYDWEMASTVRSVRAGERGTESVLGQ